MTRSMESIADAEPTGGFERRVAPLMGGLYQQALRMTRHHADAEDLVQDTLEKAFAGYGSFRPDSNINAWLHRILVNSHINNYRKIQRRPLQHSADAITDPELAASAAHSSIGLPSAEDQALKSLGDPDFMAAMLALPDHFRTTVYYADIEGLLCREIAAVMNIPIGTVVSRLHRGRRLLRQLLAEVARSHGYDNSQQLARTA